MPRCHVVKPSLESLLPLVGQEVRRRMALGVPEGLGRDELISTGQLALVEAYTAGIRALRLAVRCALQDQIRYQVVRNRAAGEMPDESTEESPRESVVMALVSELPDRQRKAVVLVYEFGMTQAEAAEEMGTQQQDISALLIEAQKKLRERLVKFDV